MSIQSTVEFLIEALSMEHEARVGHDFKTYDSSRRHCNTCFYLKMAAQDAKDLPGDDMVVVTRKKKAGLDA